jgi:hypothetical protein
MQIELERNEIVAIVVALRSACEKWRVYYDQTGDAGDIEQVKRYSSLVQRLEAKLSDWSSELEAKLNEERHPNDD